MNNLLEFGICILYPAIVQKTLKMRFSCFLSELEAKKMMKAANLTYLAILGVLLFTAHGDLSDLIFENQPSCGCSGGAKLARESGNAPSDANRNLLEIETAESFELDPIVESMAFIPGGKSYVGSNKPKLARDGEGPRREVILSPFYIDKHEVSNADFAKFVQATNYVTESETFGWSFVFHTAVPEHIKSNITQSVLGAEWWLPVNGSYWREPEGPGTDVFATDRGNYPVVQVSWNDAVAFCQWRNNSRLPTEAEWETAARGPPPRPDAKIPNNMFPWGQELEPKGIHRANVFQGVFPINNTKEDGYEFLCPVDAFGPQNAYGLYNMIGNVWEWVHDWWTIYHSPDLTTNPQGPETGRERVKKGGSFLCHQSYCYRYRTIARFPSTPDSATLNVGFRCARTVNEVGECENKNPEEDMTQSCKSNTIG